MTTLRICTHNILEGFSQFNRRLAIHDLRDRLPRLLNGRGVLQEVQACTCAMPSATPTGQASLSTSSWPATCGSRPVYGGNAITTTATATPSCRHHPAPGQPGRSDHRFESRGLLHCEVNPRHRGRCIRMHRTRAHRRQPASPDGGHRGPLVDQLRRSRRRAADHRRRLQRLAQPRPTTSLTGPLGLSEVFLRPERRPCPQLPEHACRCCASTASTHRGFAVDKPVHMRPPMGRISDHAALTALLRSA